MHKVTSDVHFTDSAQRHMFNKFKFQNESTKSRCVLTVTELQGP